MASIKICPTCGKENSAFEMLCVYCMNDISGVAPFQESDTSGKNEDRTITEKKDNIIFECNNGGKIIISDGDIVGRENKGSELFTAGPQEGKTVSRKHAKISFKEGKWFVEDLNSQNGTFINDSKLNPGQSYQLGGHDKIEFSTTSLKFTAKI